MSTDKKPKTLEQEVEVLFSDPAISSDVATQYLTMLQENLYTTEKAIQTDFYRMTLAFLGFLILDSGIVEQVSIAGAQFKKSGYLAIVFPLVIAFLYYQFQCRISFSHDIRTCFALFYRKLNINLYRGFFDGFLHYPSIRNVESYQGKVDFSKTRRKIGELSTSVVTFVLSLGPIYAVAYTVYRARYYSDLPLAVWLASLLLSSLFIVRGLMLVIRDSQEDSDWYSDRREKPSK
jgi:hypothetical protein